MNIYFTSLDISSNDPNDNSCEVNIVIDSCPYYHLPNAMLNENFHMSFPGSIDLEYQLLSIMCEFEEEAESVAQISRYIGMDIL